MSGAPLVLKDFGGVPHITPDAWNLKREAIEAARPIARVETPEQQLIAVAALRKLKDVLKGMESTRKDVKAPVLALGRQIDSIAHDFTADIESQFGRLSGMVNYYQRKQARERGDKEDEIQSSQALATKLREQAASLRGKITNAKGADCTNLAHEATKLETEAFDLEMNAEVALVPAIDKPQGLVVKSKINFQVIDPIVFAQAWPQFWLASSNNDHENELLRVDRMKILDELNREDGKGAFHMTRFPEELSQTDDRRLVQPAGLRVYEETKSHVR